METDFIYLSSIIVAILFVSIAFFQVLLSLGYPIGEYAMADPVVRKKGLL